MGNCRLLIAGAAVAACTGLRPLPPDRQPQSVVLRDVTIVDVVAGRLAPHMTVTVLESRIVGVGPAGSMPAPRDARVIEGDGRFLIPGLWDMHSHSLWDAATMPTFLSLYVTQGVTGIRDMGGNLAVLSAFRDSLTRGSPAWPRVVASGAVLDGPKPAQPDISIAVADAASAEAAVDSLARAGVNFVKVYTLLLRDAYSLWISRAPHGASTLHIVRERSIDRQAGGRTRQGRGDARPPLRPLSASGRISSRPFRRVERGDL